VEDEESSALRSVPYGDREGYTGVFTGRREIRVFERDVSVAAASGIAELEEDQYYAAFVYSANNSIDQTVLVTRVPQEQEITSGKTRAQFVNLLTNTDSPEYIRAVRADTGTELATGIGRGRSSGYLELDPLDAAIRFLDESDTEVATAEGAELQAGRSYTVWLRGVQPDSTSFGGDPDETPVTVRVDRDHD
jgi:hypothetical protein